MIDLSQEYPHHITRMCAIHANNLEEAQRRLEMHLRMGDKAEVLALTRRIKKQADKIAEYTSHLILGSDSVVTELED